MFKFLAFLTHRGPPAGWNLIDMLVHAMLERVSLIFQRDDLSIGDVGAEVNTAIEEIAKLPHSMRGTGEPSASYLRHLLLKCTTS